ncbi:sulfatase family protein [Marinovum algicola]|uniref:sulfatase family protein n=1 Tax=Marinovum algicola TaxID=42444 RepID=UPI0024BA7EF0|nr:sulfatase-like hydrolase/transferase [Marinovum algicola]
MSDRPNILLISTDQQRADHLGCYRNPVVKTPTIDGLATRGTVFDRFYVACPICMPNRIAILTGRMPSVNGTRHNGIPLALDAVTYVDVLRAGGYHTAMVGKCHAQNITGHPLDEADIFPAGASGTPPPEALSDACRTRRTGPEYEAELMPLWHADPGREGPDLPYYGFDHVRFANGHADHVQGHYTGWLNERAGGNGDALRGPANALTSDVTAPQAWRTAVPEELYPTAYIAGQSRDFIDRHLNERPDDPFFLHCSFTDPHHPFTPPGRYWDMYDPADMPLPPSFAAREENEPEMLKRLRREQGQGTGDRLGPLPFCASADEVRQILALTYGMISCIDDAIAGLLAHLEACGLTENTVVIFTSDHGDFMGDHGLMLKHGLHYEGVLRVPFIWADPARIGGKRTDLPGSSIDIGAMILARAGLASFNGNQGVPLLDVLDGKAETPRRGILIEEDELGAHLGHEHGLRTRSYIEDNWRLTLWQGMDGGQLFDRNTDPHEMRNLWSDVEHVIKKGEMTESMLREAIRLGDTAPYATHVA